MGKVFPDVLDAYPWGRIRSPAHRQMGSHTSSHAGNKSPWELFKTNSSDPLRPGAAPKSRGRQMETGLSDLRYRKHTTCRQNGARQAGNAAFAAQYARPHIRTHEEHAP